MLTHEAEPICDRIIQTAGIDLVKAVRGLTVEIRQIRVQQPIEIILKDQVQGGTLFLDHGIEVNQGWRLELREGE